MPQRTIWAAVTLLAIGSVVTSSELSAGEDAGALDGRSFVVEVTDPSGDTTTDTLLFENGLFRSVESEEEGFAPVAYTTQFEIVLVAVAMGGEAAGAAEEDSVQGRFWYESGGGKDSSSSMDLAVVDGLAVPDELQGGERVKVVLVGEPLDRERFLESLAETGKVLFTAMRLGIDRRVEFDVCRYEDGSEVEICGLHIHGPGLSDSSSGFGVYDHFTELVQYEDGRVRAKLRTAEPEEKGDLTFGFDLAFDLPIAP